MPTEHPALAPARQLLLVLAPQWESASGTLYRYERALPGDAWQLLETVPVSLGRNGLAWGSGLHGAALGPGPVKHEGDQKAPAGLFALGTAFGYGEAPGEAGGLPYHRITEQTLGIEDPASRFYNTIVERDAVPAPDWKAADHMLRADSLYRYGVVVQHNADPGVQPQALGSCIFLHVWRGAGQATAGCTAMEEQKMAALLGWLRASAQPRLVQLTTADYTRLRDEWGLPATPEPPPLTFTLLGVGALVMGLGAWLYARRRWATTKR